MKSWSAPAVPLLREPSATLQLFDTASGEVRVTASGETARMYVCGITPYDATHIGHAATYITFDLIHRFWRAAGRDVEYVQNVTDVDDPLLERAARDGISWEELAAGQIDLYRSDMTALRVLPPTEYVGAVETIDEVSAAVERLVEAGAAYRLDDAEYPDVYFDVGFTGRFGYESGYDEPLMLALSAERGGDPDRPGKRHRLDPLLWRLERPGEPAWPSPLGRGRPGWHIECAVIAIHRLGGRIDVQGGGSDLIFPHHECSAAHAEALTGEHPFASHYVHAGMLTLDGEKMSKSLGNLEFVSRLTAAGVDPMAIRAALLDAPYREDRPWSDALLTTARERLSAWRAAASRRGDDATSTVRELLAAVGDNLDTPRALRILDTWSADERAGGAEVADAADAVLGLDLR